MAEVVVVTSFALSLLNCIGSLQHTYKHGQLPSFYPMYDSLHCEAEYVFNERVYEVPEEVYALSSDNTNCLGNRCPYMVFPVDRPCGIKTTNSFHPFASLSRIMAVFRLLCFLMISNYAGLLVCALRFHYVSSSRCGTAAASVPWD